jgi:hypothetical protein
MCQLDHQRLLPADLVRVKKLAPGLLGADPSDVPSTERSGAVARQADPPPYRSKRKATQADFLRMRADYDAAEARRQERQFRYVCPGCNHPDHAHDVGVRP